MQWLLRLVITLFFPFWRESDLLMEICMHAFGLFQKLMYILINDIVTTRTTQLLHGSLLSIKVIINIVFTFL